MDVNCFFLDSAHLIAYEDASRRVAPELSFEEADLANASLFDGFDFAAYTVQPVKSFPVPTIDPITSTIEEMDALSEYVGVPLDGHQVADRLAAVTLGEDSFVIEAGLKDTHSVFMPFVIPESTKRHVEDVKQIFSEFAPKTVRVSTNITVDQAAHLLDTGETYEDMQYPIWLYSGRFNQFKEQFVPGTFTPCSSYDLGELCGRVKYRSVIGTYVKKLYEKPYRDAPFATGGDVLQAWLGEKSEDNFQRSLLGKFLEVDAYYLPFKDYHQVRLVFSMPPSECDGDARNVYWGYRRHLPRADRERTVLFRMASNTGGNVDALIAYGCALIESTLFHGMSFIPRPDPNIYGIGDTYRDVARDYAGMNRPIPFRPHFSDVTDCTEWFRDERYIRDLDLPNSE